MAAPAHATESVVDEITGSPSKYPHLGFQVLCLALAEVCVWWVWGFATLDERSLLDLRGRYGPLLPAMTDGLFKFRVWLFLFPLPWLVTAGWWSTTRRRIAHVQLVKFVGTLLLALLCLCLFAAGAMVLPWMPFKTCTVKAR